MDSVEEGFVMTNHTIQQGLAQMGIQYLNYIMVIYLLILCEFTAGILGHCLKLILYYTSRYGRLIFCAEFSLRML